MTGETARLEQYLPRALWDIAVPGFELCALPTFPGSDWVRSAIANRTWSPRITKSPAVGGSDYGRAPEYRWLAETQGHASLGSSCYVKKVGAYEEAR